MLPDYFEFSLPTKLIYGIGILRNLNDALKPFGKRKAIVVTDQVLVKAGPVEAVRAGLTNSDIDVACIFDQVPPNSTLQTVEACAALAKKHACDMFIAVGGGSVIDTAKVANLLTVKGGDLASHMGAYLLDSQEQLLPAIFIPTTAGTGSEVTRVAVIADSDQDVKLPFTESQFLPQMAILDPEMTVSMPGKLTAATGMDALTHAIEAYVDKEWSPASDALALHAITLISNNILQVCAHPMDLQARGAMLVGSFLAGVAFSHSMVGMCHGIAHALGGVYHIPHGLANALVLPEVMAYNLEECTDRYAQIALAMGISFPQIIHQSRSVLQSNHLDIAVKLAKHAHIDRLQTLVGNSSYRARNVLAHAIGNLGFVDNWVRKQAAQAAVDKVGTLNRQLAFLTGMPLNLKDAGVDDHLAKLDQVTTTAMEDGAMLYNPVEPQPDAVAAIVSRLYQADTRPLKVVDSDLRPHTTGSRSSTAMDRVFKDSDMLYAVFLEFYKSLKQHPTIGPKLLHSDLCVQFKYKNPTATITIDATGDSIDIFKGADFEGSPEVTMSMNADFAHQFWHGKANLVSALTRRQVTARGNVPKTIKLLPILKPAYALYPQFLRQKGLDEIVMV